MIKPELQPIISRTEAVCFFSPSSLSPLRERQWLVSMCLNLFIDLFLTLPHFGHAI